MMNMEHFSCMFNLIIELKWTEHRMFIEANILNKVLLGLLFYHLMFLTPIMPRRITEESNMVVPY